MVSLRLTLLGGFEAQLISGAALPLATKKAQALLAYLGTQPNHRHSRDKLAVLLWGEKSDDRARGDLRHALVALRRALGKIRPEPLKIEGQGLSLNPSAVEVDVRTFEKLVAEGTPTALEEAAELYRGDLLLGFTVNEPLFEEWLLAERERLRHKALDAMTRLLVHQTETTSPECAIRTAVRLLALDPLQETVHRALMRLYVRQGRRSAALKQYQACVGLLRRELGTEPEAETRALYQDSLQRPAGERRATDAEHVPRPDVQRVLPSAPPDFPAPETALFGRQAELERLRRMLDAAVQGHGQVACVVGEAGIGKTRLVSALAAEALTLGCRVLIGRCHESDSILPFGPWVDAMRAGQPSIDEAILGSLHPARRAELSRLFPEATVAGLAEPGASALALFEGMTDLVAHMSARQPLILVLEDMHWADDMSLRLLAFVSRRSGRWPVLLVPTARDDDLGEAPLARRTIGEITRGSAAARVVLTPLSEHDTSLLVRALALAGTDTQTVARLTERVWAMSEGNPFVAVEALRSLDEGRQRETAATLTLPTSVRDLVARRLDRLSPGTQPLAAVATVIGRGFDFALLRLAGGVGERDAAEAVEEMVRHQVLQAVGDRLDFTHDRVRRVAYDRLLVSRRRVLHRAVFEALELMAEGSTATGETSRQDRPGDQIEQLAHHALRAELLEKAVLYLHQAGDRAAARSALGDARAWFEQALGALQELQPSRSMREEAYEIRLALRPVLAQLGEFPGVLAILREAGALAEELNDERRQGRVWAFMTSAYARLNQLDEALATGHRALTIAERLGDSSLRVLATTYLVLVHSYRGEYARSVDLATVNLAVPPSDRVQELQDHSQVPSINDRAWLVVGLSHLGRFAEAAEHAAEAIRLAEPTLRPDAVGLAYHSAAALHLVKGDWAQAHAMNEREIAVLRRGNVVGELLMALAYSARVLAYLGDVSQALDRLRECEPLLGDQRAKGGVGNGWVYYSLGRASLVLGRPDEAQRLAECAVETASGRSDFMPNTLHLLADIATHPDRVDAERSEGHYREALALAEARGMRPLIAHCHLGLGTFHGRIGHCDHARQHLTTATTMYRDMGMSYWLEEAEAALQKLGP